VPVQRAATRLCEHLTIQEELPCVRDDERSVLKREVQMMRESAGRCRTRFDDPCQPSYLAMYLSKTAASCLEVAPGRAGHCARLGVPRRVALVV